MSLPALPALPVFTADPGAVERCAQVMLSGSSAVDDLASFTIRAERPPGFEGVAAASYATGATVIRRQADAMSLALRRVARDVFGHADELTRLGEEHARLAERRLALQQDLHDLAGLLGLPADHPLWRHTRLDPDDVVHRVSALGQDIREWQRRLAEAESAVMRSWQRLGSRAQVMRRFGGRDDPADVAITTLPLLGATPAATRGWWAALSPAERIAVIAAYPDLIGNRDGLPAWARHRANALRIQRDIATVSAIPSGERTEEQRRLLANAIAARDALTRLEGVRDPFGETSPPAQVYLYDPLAYHGDGRVAIGVGDLDRADDIATITPGYGTDGHSAPQQAERTEQVWQASRVMDPQGSPAVMLTIASDLPDHHAEPSYPGPMPLGFVVSHLDTARVLSEDAAEVGGHRLSDLLDGLAEMRSDDPHLTVIGHSYGSTVASFGAAEAGPEVVDELVLTGSPGAGREFDHADDLGLGADHVWAGRDSADPIVRAGNHGWWNLESAVGGGLGTDPAAAEFGAQRFTAETPDREGASLLAPHHTYYDHDTESLRNIALVVTDQPDRVEAAPGVTDPLLWGPRDPEDDRVATTPDTDGR